MEHDSSAQVLHLPLSVGTIVGVFWNSNAKRGFKFFSCLRKLYGNLSVSFGLLFLVDQWRSTSAEIFFRLLRFSSIN